MDILYTFEDLKELKKESGNENPSIFILNDIKTKDKYEEAFCPTNIFIDNTGDIIIQVDEHKLKQ